MITVIGYDGTPLKPSAAEALANASLVVGGRRHLAAVQVPVNAHTIALGDLASALDTLAAHRGDAVVIASGDPGFFGIVRALTERGIEVVVHPAVSAVAAAFGRAGICWDDALVVSAHGRALGPAVNACRAHPKVAVLTAPEAGPAELGAALQGWPRQLVVAECLGTAEERVRTCTPAEAVRQQWSDPNVAVVVDTARDVLPRGWMWPRGDVPQDWALPESAFAHRDSMVTKAEVRALALARLAPRTGTLVWDIGAGSGAIAVEAARFGAAVIAVERDADQCARIAANARTHGVAVQVHEASAPAALTELPDPDAVFVGGGGSEAVTAVTARAPTRIVVALAAVERVGPTADVLDNAGYLVDGTQLQSSRLARLPDGTRRLAATNPVHLVWGVRR